MSQLSISLHTNMARESFNSRIGSILALAGSAVGLGNIWRFPYMVSEYGGGAFILVYLLCIAVVALPIMLSEFIVGRYSHVGASSAVGKIQSSGYWKHFGILAVAIPFFTLCYYCIIGGWTLQYLMDSCLMRFQGGQTSESIQAMFGNLVTAPFKPIILDCTFLLITAIIIMNGVNKGIEKCSEIMMPVLFFIMLFIAVWIAFQPGAGQGMAYLFKPDFSKITPQVFLAAMGQSFYSMSIGMGILITYSSYLDHKVKLTPTAISTILADLVFAIIAGCAIIPALFAYGMPTDQGTGLVFKTLPVVFSQMPMGSIVSIIFFFAVFLAALTSAMSLFEVPVSWLIDTRHMSRRGASALVFICALAIGAVCSLSFGCLSGITINGRILFDMFDYTIGNYLMPLAGLIIVLFVGWKLDKQIIMDEITNVDGYSEKRKKWHRVLLFMIKWISPAAVIAVFLSGIL